MITVSALASLYGIKIRRAESWYPYLVQAAKKAEADEGQRLACFLAQLGHESGCLLYTTEIWGPTKQQEKYDGTALAKQLGNTEVGDGYKYRGRGLIQVTGKANYKTIGDKLGVDLIAIPEKLAIPQYAALSAALFWKQSRLNTYCDKYDFVGLTKRINGGTNGLAHRQALYTKALLLC